MIPWFSSRTPHVMYALVSVLVKSPLRLSVFAGGAAAGATGASSALADGAGANPIIEESAAIAASARSFERRGMCWSLPFLFAARLIRPGGEMSGQTAGRERNSSRARNIHLVSRLS